jgi:hypothetical protein
MGESFNQAQPNAVRQQTFKAIEGPISYRGGVYGDARLDERIQMAL